MIEQIPVKGNSAREEIVRVGRALRAVVQNFEERRLQAAKRHHLHPTDFSCVGYLYRQKKAVSPKDIGPVLGLSASSVTSLLDRLEQNGYVRRVFHPSDRRSVLIELDEKAAADLIDLYVGMQENYVSVASDFSSDQLLTIAEFLEKISQLPPKQENL
ncbi:MarR family transcriptional regulator [Pseudomonas sp. KU26590]|uniref:MarR family winged helix-turn-helix transcriptional regulator n=1 Tax=Pseudomonas sp. KU26590 TaxID=2991051 RepID=UPI00223E817F|nr:MarR family transcriptional regulator [Pseudomonas sp. KU26590]UZJ57945.1 MarR family transcriptional regulator [Pseudomonas sp. KU26590]